MGPATLIWFDFMTFNCGQNGNLTVHTVVFQCKGIDAQKKLVSEKGFRGPVGK